MDKLTVVLMSIKWLNKIERPLGYGATPTLLGNDVKFNLCRTFSRSKRCYGIQKVSGQKSWQYFCCYFGPNDDI